MHSENALLMVLRLDEFEFNLNFRSFGGRGRQLQVGSKSVISINLISYSRNKYIFYKTLMRNQENKRQRNQREISHRNMRTDTKLAPIYPPPASCGIFLSKSTLE